MADCYHKTESWILRNLTTFVQDDKLFATLHNQDLSADFNRDIPVLTR
jgi:hypothetical protein